MRLRTSILNRLTLRRWLPVLSIVAAFVAVSFVPSSGRASDFVKVGSPVADPTDFYGMASVYDRSPKQYEAWAVGGSGGTGIIIYFNGSFWQKALIPTVPTLRSVSAIRYLRTINEKGVAMTPTWTTEAWAVGDSGTILRLDPYSTANTWKVLKKKISDGTTCPDADLNNPAVCVNWTANNLNTVAARDARAATLGGRNATLMEFSEAFPGEVQAPRWDAAPVGTGSCGTTGRGPCGTDEVTDIEFIDPDHGWLVGFNGNTGRLWRYNRNLAGYRMVTQAAGVLTRYRSVTALLRKSATTINTPLKSVVWIGAERMDIPNQGKIIRYDESDGSQSVLATSNIIRGLTLTRRSGGQQEELVRNGDFSGDRQDAGGLINRYADGWTQPLTSLTGGNNGTSIIPSALVTGESGKAVSLEAWQKRENQDALTEMGEMIIHQENWFGGFPFGGFGWSAGGFSSNLKSTDMTKTLMNITAPYVVNFGYNIGAPYQIGAGIWGYIKVPNINVADQVVRFRIQAPKGRVGLSIENDRNDRRCELANGTPTGVLCPNGTGCNAGESCVDHTAYASLPTAPQSSRIVWTPGQCANKNAQNPVMQCLDDSECAGWGYCQDNPAKRCRQDGGPGFFNGCDNAPCIPWATTGTLCSGVSATVPSTVVDATFQRDTGILTHECTNAADLGKFCVDDTQCSNSAGACKVRGGGWFPFSVQYFQVNTARCSGDQRVPCTSNSQCAESEIGTCVTGKWCNTGANQGKSCTLNPSICGAGNSCVDQYQSKCVTKTTRSCISNKDCQDSFSDTDTCQSASTPLAPFQISWDRDAAGNSTPGVYADIPTGSLMMNNANAPRTSLTQEIPFTNLQGTSYRVAGRYKVEYLRAYDSYITNDPRRPFSSQAGIRTRCATGTDTCGYDNNLFQTNGTIGVTSGTCSLNSGVTCKTDVDCAPSSGVCNGNWTDFSTVITKHQRNANGTAILPDDPAQSLVVECYSDANLRISCDNVSVTPINDAAETKYDSIDIWAVGDAGAILRSTFNFEAGLPAMAAANWVTQVPVTTAPLRAITSSDPFHLWSSGDHIAAGENATVIRMSPGNVSGWAWIGAATSAAGIDPIGWTDFNCGNVGTCTGQPTAYGVSVDINPLSPAIGAFSGSAWVGSQDANETVDFGTCQGIPSGKCNLDNVTNCATSADCLLVPGAGTICNPRTNCGGTCQYAPTRICSNQGQCRGTCSKNQGFRCLSDSDCQISCDDNPIACRAIGWLSFDSAVTGRPPVPVGDEFYTTPYTAKFNLSDDSVRGWARLQLGRCNNGTTPSASSNYGCYQNASCPITGSPPTQETCDWTSAPSVPNQITSANAYSQAGWVKLRGDPSPDNNDHFQCLDCSVGATPATGACKICLQSYDAGSQPRILSCNACNNACTLKRCQDAAQVACNDDAGCVGGAKCKQFGLCDFSDQQGGVVCFSNNDCNDQKCIFGAQCNVASCTNCYTYSVSIDNGVTKNFAGYGYSPDLGWIDFSRATLGGQLFFQTKFGDLYAGGNIGSPSTGVAPGSPGASPLCNATYRIVSAGTITNFCSNAQQSPPSGTTLVDPLQSPFIQPKADRLQLPTGSNQYTANIGTIDRIGLSTPVNTTGTLRNKFGDPVETPEITGGNIDASVLFGCPVSGLCKPALAGKVFVINGNLTVDRDLEFQPGGGFPTKFSGAGTFIINGNLVMNASMYYATAGGIFESRYLPSVAFLVSGDISVDPSVNQTVGTYYSEGTITVASYSPGGADQQFVARGVMIAKAFDFRRKYRGSGDSQAAAETIVYDGRLQANTPPGLGQISSALPSVQEAVP